MSIEELFMVLKVMAVDNYDMKAPEFAKLVEKRITEIMTERASANEQADDNAD